MHTVIADCRISEACERGLMTRGFNVIKTPPFKNLGAAVASHPDMLMLTYKNKIITSAEYCDTAPYVFSDIRELVPSSEIIFTEDTQRESYPQDAIFNALIMGNKMFCRERSVSRAVKELAEKEGLSIVNVNQGYPACTVLPLSDEAAITSDKGMARALQENGISVTLIRDGDIALPPYEYGFIGGAAGVLEDKVYFLGSVESHRDKTAIKKACDEAKVVPVSLSDEGLVDLGRLLFL